MERIYYNQGWNDYIDGILYQETAALDWRDGWRDAQECAMNAPQDLGKTEE